MNKQIIEEIVNILNQNFDRTNSEIELNLDEENNLYIEKSFKLENNFQKEKLNTLELPNAFVEIDEENNEIILSMFTENTEFNTQGIASLFLTRLLTKGDLEFNGKIYVEDVEEFLENDTFLQDVKFYASLKDENQILKEVKNGLNIYIKEFEEIEKQFLTQTEKKKALAPSEIQVEKFSRNTNGNPRYKIINPLIFSEKYPSLKENEINKILNNNGIRKGSYTFSSYSIIDTKRKIIKDLEDLKEIKDKELSQEEFDKELKEIGF